jgi:hypothetical protein
MEGQRIKLRGGEWVTFLAYSVEPGDDRFDTRHWALVLHDEGQVEAVLVEEIEPS